MRQVRIDRTQSLLYSHQLFSMPDKSKGLVYVSSVIPAVSVSDVWEVVGPYDKIPGWLPVGKCTIEPGTGGANQVSPVARVVPCR